MRRARMAVVEVLRQGVAKGRVASDAFLEQAFLDVPRQIWPESNGSGADR
jgi:hypothetical protein